MSFDPFGDFATDGYLRNVGKEKDLDIAGDENEVVGNVDAPEVKAQYEAMLLKREKEN